MVSDRRRFRVRQPPRRTAAERHHAAAQLPARPGGRRRAPGCFHDRRHTFAARMAAASVPMRTLQEWMGHHDYKTTAIYAEYAPSEGEVGLVNRLAGTSLKTVTIRRVGFEPTRPEGQCLLRASCLPFHHRRGARSVDRAAASAGRRRRRQAVPPRTSASSSSSTAAGAASNPDGSGPRSGRVTTESPARAAISPPAAMSQGLTPRSQ